MCTLVGQRASSAANAALVALVELWYLSLSPRCDIVATMLGAGPGDHATSDVESRDGVAQVCCVDYLCLRHLLRSRSSVQPLSRHSGYTKGRHQTYNTERVSKAGTSHFTSAHRVQSSEFTATRRGHNHYTHEK
eukprot:scaffold46577_cov105-Phaeocystis_antarctica.AAC.2